MSTPTWAELLVREPKLGDLLAKVRAWRGDDGSAFMWWPGGIQDQLIALTAPRRWPLDEAAIDAYDVALDTLWDALAPDKKGAGMDDQVARRAEIQRELSEISQGLWEAAMYGDPADAKRHHLLAHWTALLSQGDPWAESLVPGFCRMLDALRAKQAQGEQP